MKITTKAFWLDLAERATKTAAQAAIGFLGVGSGVLGIDWKAAAVGVLTAVGVSILTSLASLKNDGETASAVPGLVGKYVLGDHSK